MRPIWKLNHLQKIFKSCQTYKINDALNKVNETINIPCSISLTVEDKQKIVEAIKQYK